MAEKRFYRLKGPNGFEAFYAGHGLNQIKDDAATLAGGVPSDIKHVTLQAWTFYKELEETERARTVVSSKVKGVGSRWVVEVPLDEDDSPFGKAASDGGVPPSLEGDPFPDDEYGWDAEDERRYRKMYISNPAFSEEIELPYGDPCNEPPPAALVIDGIPTEESPVEKKNGKTGELPTIEEMDAELEELRRDPSTYPVRSPEKEPGEYLAPRAITATL